VAAVNVPDTDEPLERRPGKPWRTRALDRERSEPNYWQNGARNVGVTGSTTLAAIRASHIKPWCKSNNSERLDPDNGLPLVGTLDALFNAGLITFTQDGRMLVSKQLDSEIEHLGVLRLKLVRKPDPQTAEYLEYHREWVFKGI